MSIVVCLPVMGMPHKKHTPHFIEWYAENKAKHDLHLQWEMDRPLQKVQSNAVELAKEIGASHVLFTEHDHWGYPIDGLDVLLEADKDVIGFVTYMRKYPYLPMCMKKSDPTISFVTDKRNLKSFYPTQALEKTDLITWAFTLVKTDVFVRMEAEGRDPWVWDSVPTDSHFCQHCEEMGIDRWMHAAFCVNHGDLPKEHVVFYRRMYDSLNAAHGFYPKGSMPPSEIVPQNEEDPHGVVPYVDQVAELLGDAKALQKATERAAAEFAEAK